MSKLDRDQEKASRDSLVDRATQLFRFLGHAQQLKSKPPRTVDTYHSVLWLVDLPEHPAVTTAHRDGTPEPSSALLAIDRVSQPAPPDPGEALTPWLSGELDDLRQPPQLRDSILAVDVETTVDTGND